MDYAKRVEAHLQAPMRMMRPVKGLDDMFARCFLNTLESTLVMEKNENAYVITGDIHAMWLRDSTQQMLHYLRFAKQDGELAAVIESLIERQAQCVLIDPYANAFNQSANGRHGYDDLPPSGAHVWERKYELDSLCHVVLLAWNYLLATGNDGFLNNTFLEAMHAIITVIEIEQRHQTRSSYTFERPGGPASDTLSNGGRGEPVGYTGMSWSGFRPSDDACRYGYLVPANLFAARMMDALAVMAGMRSAHALAAQAEKIAREIRNGIETFAVVHDETFGEIYAYEVDGLGNRLMMDDANIPSLLSLPYLGVCDLDDPRYLNTRAFVLSRKNPQFFSGKIGCGIGSPHTPQGYIWTISLCMQGITARDDEEILYVFKQLITTHGDTARMHESFSKDDATQFTRSWFAWANSMFGEFLYRLYEHGKLPALIERIKENDINSIFNLN